MPHIIDGLSEPEITVLRLRGEGESYREIARRLNIAVGIVHMHLGNICGKLCADKGRLNAAR